MYFCCCSWEVRGGTLDVQSLQKVLGHAPIYWKSVVFQFFLKNYIKTKKRSKTTMGKQSIVNGPLKKFRLDNRLNQGQMADLLNITPSQYSKIETGKCFLNLHHIEALASNLGKDFKEIYAIINDIIPI